MPKLVKNHGNMSNNFRNGLKYQKMNSLTFIINTNNLRMVCLGQEIKTSVLSFMPNMSKVLKLWGFKKRAKKEC